MPGALSGSCGVGAGCRHDMAVRRQSVDRFPLVMGLVAVTTFLLLVRTFRSVLLPLKAVVLNIVSVAATFGFVVLFWQFGVGSQQVFDVAETGAVPFWMPR